MPQKFRLTESPTQIHLLLLAHAAAAILLWFNLAPLWAGSSAVALICLLTLRDRALLRRQRGEVLVVDAARSLISLESTGQPYFYAKYKVYACRWFAILKLEDQHRPRTLILNFDSVDNPQDYRQLRRALLTLEPCRAA